LRLGKSTRNGFPQPSCSHEKEKAARRSYFVTSYAFDHMVPDCVGLLLEVGVCRKNLIAYAIAVLLDLLADYGAVWHGVMPVTESL